MAEVTLPESRNPARSTDRASQLDARIERQPAGGWRITIPLRAERVWTERATVVREEVVLRPHLVTGVERVEASVAREELRVDVHGDAHADRDATQPIVEP